MEENKKISDVSCLRKLSTCQTTPYAPENDLA